MNETHQLMQEMDRIGVHFIVGGSYPGPMDPLSPKELLAGLVAHSDARIRLSLIAVLLQHPDYASEVHNALELLPKPQDLALQLYYTAAHFLQVIYHRQLRHVSGQFQDLPDYFSKELHISTEGSATDQLKQLAQTHKKISGLPLDWHGTYRHAAQRVIARLQKEQEWARV